MGGPLGRWAAAWAEASQAPLAVPRHDAARATAQPEARFSHERPTQLLLGGSDPEAEATASDEQQAGRGGGVYPSGSIDTALMQYVAPPSATP